MKVDPAEWIAIGISIAAFGTSIWAGFSSHRQAVAAEKALPPPPPDVAWQLEPLGNGSYSLRNTGTKIAKGVEIDEARSVGHKARPSSWSEIPPGASVQFLLALRWQGPRANDLWVSSSAHPESVPVRIPLGHEAQ